MGFIAVGILGVCLIATLIYYLIIFPLQNLRKYKGIPSPKGLPVLGNVLEMWKSQYEFNKVLDRWAFKNGTRLVVWGSYWFPLVILGNSKDAKKILCSRDHVEKGLFYKAFDETIGTGSFNSPVAIWKQRRPHLEQAFHSKVIQKLPAIFDKTSRVLVEVLKEEGKSDGQIFDIHPYFNFATMDMLIEGAMGMKNSILQKRNDDYWQKSVEVYTTGTFIAEYIMLHPWFLVFKWLWKLSPYCQQYKEAAIFSKTYFSSLIEKRREMLSQAEENIMEPEHYDKTFPNFMDLLLYLQETKKELNLSDQDLIDELSSAYIAGHDASGKALSFAVLLLGHYPECQEKVYKELQEIFGDDADRKVSEEDLGKMRYLECCVKEALRLAPPVSFITRKAGCDIALDDSAVIPKGAEVAIATYLVHRDPVIFPQPEIFRPERFLPENNKSRDPYSWIPFSAGPRNCLGPKFAMMEMKIVLANVLRHFRVEAVGSIDKWVLNTNVTLKLEGGWNVKLHPRVSQNA